MSAISPTSSHPLRPAEPITACLLHGDVHVMSQECWEVTIDFELTHQHLLPQDRRDAYQAAVERKMLDHLIRAHLHASLAPLAI